MLYYIDFKSIWYYVIAYYINIPFPLMINIPQLRLRHDTTKVDLIIMWDLCQPYINYLHKLKV